MVLNRMVPHLKTCQKPCLPISLQARLNLHSLHTPLTLRCPQGEGLWSTEVDTQGGWERFFLCCRLDLEGLDIQVFLPGAERNDKYNFISQEWGRGGGGGGGISLSCFRSPKAILSAECLPTDILLFFSIPKVSNKT